MVLGFCRLVISIWAAVWVVPAAFASDWDSCGGTEQAAAIASCTSIIEAKQEPPKNLAYAYYNRGSAFMRMGQQDSALSDLNQAVGLNPEILDAYFNRGLLYSIQKNFDLAFRDFDHVAKVNPAAPGIYFRRGHAAHGLGDATAGIVDYTRHLEANPADAEAYFDRGVAYADIKDDDHAIADFSEALEIRANYVDALINRGTAFRRKKDFVPALADFNAAAAADPKRPEVFAIRASVLAEQGRRDEAIADYRHVLELSPPENMANAAKAALEQLGYQPGFFETLGVDPLKRTEDTPTSPEVAGCNGTNPEIAIRDCSKIIADAKAAPADLAIAYHNRADSYANQTRHDEAIEDLSQAIKLKPDFGLAYYRRGNSYYAQDKNNKALADYSKSIELRPTVSDGFTARGLTLRALGKCKKAIPDFDEAITLNPKDALAWAGRGECYLDQGIVNHAITDFDQALELDPQDPVTTRERGYAQEQRGDRVKAAADYQRTLTLSPAKKTEKLAHLGLARIAEAEPKAKKRDFDNCASDDTYKIISGCSNIVEAKSSTTGDRARALVSRALHYGMRKEFARALADFGDAIATDPTQAATAHGNRGVTHARMGNLELALQDFDAAIRLEPGHAADHANRAQALEDSGRLAEARQAYEQALLLSPSADIAAKAAEGLKRLPAAPAQRGVDDTTKACLAENTDKAFASCTQVIESGVYPQLFVGQAAALRGVISRLREDPLRAIADFDLAIKIDPNAVAPYYYRGVIQYALGRSDLALADLSKVLELEPKNTMAHAYLGVIAEESNDYSKANASFSMVLSLNDNDSATAWANDYYRRFSIVKPTKSAAAPAECGQAYSELAMAGCSELINRGYFPGNLVAAAHYRRGMFHIKRNGYPKAIADFDAQLALQPWSYDGLFIRGYMKLETSDAEGARKDLVLATRIKPDKAEAHGGLADALSRLGDQQAALAEFGLALNLARQPDILCKRAEVYAKLGQVDNALADFRAGLELRPDPAWDDFCKAGIERLTGKPFAAGQ